MGRAKSSGDGKKEEENEAHGEWNDWPQLKNEAFFSG
jgi:hypothetical protein